MKHSCGEFVEELVCPLQFGSEFVSHEVIEHFSGNQVVVEFDHEGFGMVFDALNLPEVELMGQDLHPN